MGALPVQSCMSDLDIDIPHARKLVSDLFHEASESLPAPSVSFPDSPGVRDFNHALSAALEASRTRHRQLVDDISTIVDASLASIDSILHAHSELGHKLEAVQQ